MLVQGATIVTGTGIAPFIGDVGLGVEPGRAGGEIDGGRELVQALRVDDLGDLRVFGALETIDAAGLCLVPAPGLEGRRGTVAVPDWSTLQGRNAARGRRRRRPGAAPGAGTGSYRVVRVIPPSGCCERRDVDGRDSASLSPAGRG